jgi:hypothetical protein
MILFGLNFRENTAFSTSNTAVTLVLIVCFGILLFFLVREILCWYWKINEILRRLESQEEKLDHYLKAIDSKLSIICEKGINVKVLTDIDSQTSSDDIREAIRKDSLAESDKSFSGISKEYKSNKNEVDENETGVDFVSEYEEAFRSGSKQSIMEIMKKRRYVRDLFSKDKDK